MASRLATVSAGSGASTGRLFARESRNRGALLACTDACARRALSTVSCMKHLPSFYVLLSCSLALSLAPFPSLLCLSLSPLAVEGEGLALAAATAGGRVILHTPRRGGEASAPAAAPLRNLNFGRDVTVLKAGSLPDTLPGRDALLVGTAESVQAYDVASNKDVFFRDMNDPVTALEVGMWRPSAGLGGEGNEAAAAGTATSGDGLMPMVFAGGNCVLTGLSSTGADAFWTVMGDVVTAIAHGDVDGDGAPELLVGAADFDVRCYRGEDVVAEVGEADAVTALITVPGRRLWAYALANGTVGVYNGAAHTRKWRLKAKTPATALALFDIDGDGIPEVIVGYASGRWEARKLANGDLVVKAATAGEGGSGSEGAVVGLVVGDYRGDGRPLLLVVAANGDVKGYAASDAPTLAALRAAAGSAAAGGASGSNNGGGSGGAAAAGSSTPSTGAAADEAAIAAAIAAALAERSRLELELAALGARSAAAARLGPAVLPPPSRGDATAAMAREPTLVVGLSYSAASRQPELVISLHSGASASSTEGPPLQLATASAFADGSSGAFGPGCDGVTVSALGAPPRDGHHAEPTAATVAPVTTLRLPLRLASNVPASLRVVATTTRHLALAAYTKLETTFKLPRFAGLRPLVRAGPGVETDAPSTPGSSALTRGWPAGVTPPAGGVVYSLAGALEARLPALQAWAGTAFPTSSSAPPGVLHTAAGAGVGWWETAFEVAAGGSSGGGSSRNGPPGAGVLVALVADSPSSCRLLLAADSLPLAGDLLQDAAAALGATALDVEAATFPGAWGALQATLARVAELKELQARLTGDAAASVASLKLAVLRAEDARLREDWSGMAAAFVELRGLQGAMLAELKRRTEAGGSLVSALREVNQAIQAAADLRVGEPKSRMVAACRAALKKNAPLALARIVASPSAAK